MNAIILNDNDGRREPGDVQIFKNKNETEYYSEAVDVINRSYIGIYSSGNMAKFHTTGLNVSISKSNEIDNNLL